MSFLLLLLLIFKAEAFELEAIEVKARKEISQFTFTQENVIFPDQQPGLSPISFLLPDASGTIQVQSGGPGGQVSFSIRGTENGHVLWSLDGLKINDVSNPDRSFDAGFLNSGFIEKIEIHKGPQAVLFGSDALGGVVEMTSRKGSEVPQTKMKFSGGSFGTVDSSLSQDWNTSHSRGTLHTGFFHTNGISRLNKKRYNAREADSSDMIHLSSSSKHFWNTKRESDFLFGFIHGKNELDQTTTDTKQDQSQNDQYFVQQKTTQELTNSSSLSVRNGFSRHQRSIESSLNLDSSFEGNIFQHEMLWRKQNLAFDWLIGTGSEHQDFINKEAKKNADLTSLFVQSGWRISSFKIHGGLRTDYHSRYQLFNTGSFGIGREEHSNLYSIQYSQGFKAPSLYQLFGPSLNGRPIGNSDLNPEVNRSVEARWKRKNEKVDLDLVLFRNHLENLITYTLMNGYKNQSSFISQGIDSEVIFKSDKTFLGLGLLHQDFKNAKKTILRKPLNTIKTRLNYFLSDRNELEFKVRWFDSRKDETPSGDTIKLGSYHVIDLSYMHKAGNIISGLKLLNLMNREYEEIYGFSVMPRSLFAEIQIVF